MKTSHPLVTKLGRVGISARHCSTQGDIVVLSICAKHGARVMEATLTRQQFADALFCRQIEGVPIEFREGRVLKFMEVEESAINCKREEAE